MRNLLGSASAVADLYWLTSRRSTERRLRKGGLVEPVGAWENLNEETAGSSSGSADCHGRCGSRLAAAELAGEARFGSGSRQPQLALVLRLLLPLRLAAKVLRGQRGRQRAASVLGALVEGFIGGGGRRRRRI